MAASDAKTLPEMIAKVGEIAPHLEQKIADAIRQNPHVVDPASGAVNLGLVTAIVMLDFVCWAWDEPTRGYIGPHARGDA